MITHQWWRPLAYSIFGISLGAFVVLMAWLIVAQYQVTAEIRATQTLLEDCTSPDGACYKEQQSRAAQQIGQVNAATIAAAYCATHGETDTYRHATRCVKRLLQGEGK